MRVHKYIDEGFVELLPPEPEANPLEPSLTEINS